MKQSLPQRSAKTRSVFLVALCLMCFFVALLIPTAGQSPFDNFRQRRRAPSSAQPQGKSFGEYTFVRTIYDSPQRGRRSYYGYGGGTWTTDYPEADNNFIVGLREWAGTNLKIAPRPEQARHQCRHLRDEPLNLNLCSCVPSP